MRYFRFIVLFVISCCSTIAVADDYTIYGENVKVENGVQTAMANIYMTNTETISALQFDITLPEGLDIYYGENSDGDTSYLISKGERAKSTQEITYQKLGERNYRIMVVSSTNAIFKETEVNRIKPVVSITLDLSNVEQDKKYEISLSGSVVSHYNADTYTSEPFYPSDSQFSVCVGKTYILGDVNNDQMVDIADVVCLISYLNGNTLAVVNEFAADVDGSNGINIDDVSALLDIILAK